jgi:hypothetical protein
MKVVLEPSRLQWLLNLLTLKSKYPMPIAEFKQEIVTVQNNANTLLITGFLKTKDKDRFFLKYEVNNDENIALTNSLHEAAKRCFRQDGEITFLTEGNKLYLEGDTEKYSENLLEAKTPERHVNFIETEFGRLPSKFTPKTQLVIKASELNLPWNANRYKITCDGKQFKISLTAQGEYTKILTPTRLLITEPFEAEINAEYLRPIIECVTSLPNDDNMLLSFNDQLLIINVTRKDFEIIYIIVLQGKQQ